MAIHHAHGCAIEKPRFDLDTPQWQMAARYLGAALLQGTPEDKRNAFRALQTRLPKWAQFIANIEPGSDALQRVRWQSAPQVLTGAPLTGSKWAICTIASAGYASQLDDVLTTLRKKGNIDDAQLAVIVIDRAPDVLAIAAKHGAIVIHAASKAAVNVATKAAIYSIAQVLVADFYLCLDTDILCVDALDELRSQIESAPGRIVGARSFATTGKSDRPKSLGYVAKHYYHATAEDATWLNAGQSTCKNFLRLNAGVFGGDRAAMISLDAELRTMAPRAMAWIESGLCYAADELVFSIAVAHLGGAVECDTRFNWLMYAHDAQARDGAFWNGDKRIALLHFAAGEGKAKLPHYRQTLNL